MLRLLAESGDPYTCHSHHSVVDINTFLLCLASASPDPFWDKLVTVVSGDELQTGQNVATHPDM
jgi:hypothetical protein